MSGNWIAPRPAVFTGRKTAMPTPGGDEALTTAVDADGEPTSALGAGIGPSTVARSKRVTLPGNPVPAAAIAGRVVAAIGSINAAKPDVAARRWAVVA